MALAWCGPHMGGLGLSGLAGRQPVGQCRRCAGSFACHARTHLPVTAQAIRLGLSVWNGLGVFRCCLASLPVVLDVAHNPHSVAALAHNLDAMGYFAVTRAVMGAMADKDIQSMVQRLQPLVESLVFL
jgi:dihydrofolate synthase / folylpolyglutamate synthase